MFRRIPLFVLLACWFAVAWFGGAIGRAEEIIPAAPARYFNDYALAVKPETAETLNRKLQNFEKETSNQIVVVIYPKLETDADVASYAERVFRAWKPGQAERNNGAILFVFLQNHKLWIQTGTGLEGALPDARCRQIIGDVIAPRFRAGDMDGGLTAGVDAMIASAKGEYQGTGRTVAQGKRGANEGSGSAAGFLVLIFLLIFFFVIFANRRRGSSGPRGGMFSGGGFSPIFIPMGGGGGGSSWSSGGGDFGGGDSGAFSGGGGDSGAFSGGGGDSGGGGAGGDW